MFTGKLQQATFIHDSHLLIILFFFHITVLLKWRSTSAHRPPSSSGEKPCVFARTPPTSTSSSSWRTMRTRRSARGPSGRCALAESRTTLTSFGVASSPWQKILRRTSDSRSYTRSVTARPHTWSSRSPRPLRTSTGIRTLRYAAWHTSASQRTIVPASGTYYSWCTPVHGIWHHDNGECYISAANVSCEPRYKRNYDCCPRMVLTARWMYMREDGRIFLDISLVIMPWMGHARWEELALDMRTLVTKQGI